MTIEQIKEKTKRYEELLQKKKELADETKDNNAELDKATIELAEAISDADLTSIDDGDYTYTPTVNTRFSLKGMDALAEEGLDRFEPFENDEALKHLVKKNINAQALQSALKEMADTEEGIPDEVMAVVNTYDKIGISRTKKDNTSKKNKVKDAIKARRDSNV